MWYLPSAMSFLEFLLIIHIKKQPIFVLAGRKRRILREKRGATIAFQVPRRRLQGAGFYVTGCGDSFPLEQTSCTRARRGSWFLWEPQLCFYWLILNMELYLWIKQPPPPPRIFQFWYQRVPCLGFFYSILMDKEKIWIYHPDSERH